MKKPPKRPRGPPPTTAEPQPDPEIGQDRQRLLHELEVHKFELELQNEELRTARVEMEAGLRRYTQLFDFAPIGYAILASDGTIREINRAGASLLRWERARRRGLRFAAFIAPDSAEALNNLLVRALTSESRVSDELDTSPDIGPSLRLRLTASPLAGPETTILVTFEDITEARAREQQLVNAEAGLREASRRTDEFLAMLSHELRNPLAPIRTSLQLLSRVDPAGEHGRQALRIIDRQVGHLTRLVDDLLDVTRIVRGKVELRRELVELIELVRRTVDDHRSSFDAAGVTLTVEVPPAALWVRADPARLAQVLSNLLGNAEKFTPPGGRVVVTLVNLDPFAGLQVSDTGVGIAPEVLPHLFAPFRQAPQALDRPRGGLGLGLAMVKGLVELHGGSVRLTSPGPGRGTEVTILLPREQGPERPTPRPEPLPPRARRVLVIEDNPDAAESLQELLRLFGHEVRVAGDGPVGITLAHAFRPEVVLCDLGLPGMDGFAVARAFRASDELRGAYLVALSGYARPEDLARATAAGFDRHLAKPPDLDALARLIAEAP